MTYHLRCSNCNFLDIVSKDKARDWNCPNCEMKGIKMTEKTPLTECVDPPSFKPETKWINVNGREEHEAVIRDAGKCKELGVDQAYEVMVYLHRWGGWLKDGLDKRKWATCKFSK